MGTVMVIRPPTDDIWVSTLIGRMKDRYAQRVVLGKPSGKGKSSLLPAYAAFLFLSRATPPSRAPFYPAGKG